ncbi:carbohydrate diacid regulator [Silvimonas terrae]|uniref:Carbohydrate diacid regulator n=1 Tax=Silvimonas terrae TaxID=300266 RepID=A0A840RDJ4_9NEIS|nr:sugar diacid recognition domain-containing protein [Silvimonas terrae]MBB5191047.1 carbohydrate diacid regulator [Silvimonas terrae]
MLELDPLMAQRIADRAMQAIDCNVNVMDAHGIIIGSGDKQRLGSLHEGAVLAISRARTVEVDQAAADQLRGVRPGINLPLRAQGHIVGAIGLTGEPAAVRQVGELVRMTAEMMLEQLALTHLLERDSRLREELVLHLIRDEPLPESLMAWAQRLQLDLTMPRVVAVVEIDSSNMAVDEALQELQQVHALLVSPARDNLVATVSLTELVILKPALDHNGQWQPEVHRKRVHALLGRMHEPRRSTVRIALGQYFAGSGGIARSWRTARATLAVGKSRQPGQQVFCYQDLVFPVLLDGLREGWQATEIRQPLLRLAEQDPRGQLRRTLAQWFAHNMQPLATATALHIHRNTLDYRLRRIEEISGLRLAQTDDCMRLYLALQLADPA